MKRAGAPRRATWRRAVRARSTVPTSARRPSAAPDLAGLEGDAVRSTRSAARRSAAPRGAAICRHSAASRAPSAPAVARVRSRSRSAVRLVLEIGDRVPRDQPAPFARSIGAIPVRRDDRDRDEFARRGTSAAPCASALERAGFPATTSSPTKTTAPPSAAAPPTLAADGARARSRRPGRGCGRPRREATSSGRAAQTIDERREHGHLRARTRSSAARAAAPRATRSRRRRPGAPTFPAGIVFGSVIMKKRKTRISGEKARTRQKYQSETGPRCQRAVMSCPLAASTAMLATNVTQKVMAMCSSRSRRRIAKPPAMMIASASASQGDIGPHQNSSGSACSGPSSRKQRTSPKFDGLKMWPPAELDQVLREQRDGSRAGEDPPAVHAPPVAVLRPRHAEDEGDAVAGQERACRPEDHVLAPERDPHLEHGAGQQRDEDLGDREAELERHLPEDLQRDDHGREVEARVADASAAAPGTVVPRIRRVGLPRAGSAHRAHGMPLSLQSTRRECAWWTGA